MLRKMYTYTCISNGTDSFSTRAYQQPLVITFLGCSLYIIPLFRSGSLYYSDTWTEKGDT